MGTVSDVDGRFVLKVDQHYVTLIFEFLNMKTASQTLNLIENNSPEIKAVLYPGNKAFKRYPDSYVEIIVKIIIIILNIQQ